MQVAQRLMDLVKEVRPDLYEAILYRIRPHRLSSVLKLFQQHLARVVRVSEDEDPPLWKDDETILHLLNRHRETLPEFCWQVIRHMKFPTPGDAYGIHLTCRVTQSDTQGTLDSKHLHQSSASDNVSFNVEKELLDELLLFTSQLQVFEIANRHRFATVYLKTGEYTVQHLLDILPRSGHLERGGPPNKGKDGLGRTRYLSSFTFIIVEDRGLRVLYQSSKDLFLLLKHVPLDRISAFSDVRSLFQKCGIVCYFFNMVRVTFRQLLWSSEPGSVYEKDVLTLIKYQCRSGTPLPLTRDGLAKNPVRSPIEVLSFEAPKKNYARLSTSAETRDRWYEVKTSSDKIFFGQQFNEGTGYCFAVIPQTDK